MKKFFLTGAFAIFSLFAFSQGFMVNFNNFDTDGFDMSSMTDDMSIGTFVNSNWAIGITMQNDVVTTEASFGDDGVKGGGDDVAEVVEDLTGWFARYYFNDNMFVSFTGNDLDIDTDGMDLGFGYTMMVNDWLAVEPTVSGNGIGIDDMDFSLSVGMRF